MVVADNQGERERERERVSVLCGPDTAAAHFRLAPDISTLATNI